MRMTARDCAKDLLRYLSGLDTRRFNFNDPMLARLAKKGRAPLRRALGAVPAMVPGPFPRQGDGEMVFRAIHVALLVSILPIAGCGTVVNLVRPGPEQGGKTPFGGVRQDVRCIEKGSIEDWESGPEPHSPPQAAVMLCCAADLPFSFIGDVLTWPYTAGYTWINQPVPVPPVIQAPPGPPVVQAPLGTKVPAAAAAPAGSRPQTTP